MSATNGRVLRAVARRTLRSGRFRATIPAGAPGALYKLSLTVGRQRYWSWIATPKPLPAPAPAPTPTPPATPAPAPAPGTCDGAGVPETTVTPAALRAGELLQVRVRNAGPGCLSDQATQVNTWETLNLLGEWEPVPRSCDGGPPPDPPSGCVGLPAFHILFPGESFERAIGVPDFPPGRYRVTSSIPGVLRFEFEVLAVK